MTKYIYSNALLKYNFEVLLRYYIVLFTQLLFFVTLATSFFEGFV